MNTIKRIKAPKFRINGKYYNECEVRNVMLDVAKGNLPEGIVISEGKFKCSVRRDGSLTFNLLGLSKASDLALDLFLTRN